MYSQFVAFAAIIAVARAGIIAQPAVAYHAQPAYAQQSYIQPAAVYHQQPAAVYHQPAVLQKTLVHSAPVLQKTYAAPQLVAKHQVEDYDPNPQYQFSYDIHDSLTGDAKAQHESRDGDVVKGQYSLIEADGSRRIVDYTADPVNGFNAVVHKEAAHSGSVHKVVQAPQTYTVQKTIVPTVQKTLIAQPTLTKIVSSPNYHAQPQYVHY